MALSFGLLAGRRDVGARCIDVDGCGGPGPQELVVNRTDAAADVKDGLPIDPAGAERLDERASEAPGTLPMVVAQLLRGVASVELSVVFRVFR